MQTFEMDHEILFKLFLKIAWTHSAKQFRIEWTSNRLSRWIIQYLTSGHMDDLDLATSNPELFTKPVQVDQKEYTFWKYNIDKSQSIIEAITNAKKIKRKLLEYHDIRNNDFNLASQLISYSDASIINDELRLQEKKLRYHSLCFRNIQILGRESTVCWINLFGGVFDVLIQICAEPIMNEYPLDLIIDF